MSPRLINAVFEDDAGNRFDLGEPVELIGEAAGCAG